MLEVPLAARSPEEFAGVVPDADLDRYRRLVSAARDRLEGRRLWHVNSTPAGGGVAEILRSCLPTFGTAGSTSDGS